MRLGYRLGVDVGGTFTDLLLFNTETGAFWRHKTPSTPHDSSEGILTGVDAICAEAHQLHRVCRRADSAVSPDLDVAAQSCLS